MFGSHLQLPIPSDVCPQKPGNIIALVLGRDSWHSCADPEGLSEHPGRRGLLSRLRVARGAGTHRLSCRQPRHMIATEGKIKWRLRER